MTDQLTKRRTDRIHAGGGHEDANLVAVVFELFEFVVTEFQMSFVLAVSFAPRIFVEVRTRLRSRVQMSIDFPLLKLDAIRTAFLINGGMEQGRIHGKTVADGWARAEMQKTLKMKKM